jgi:hypothetical protein
MVDGRCGRSTPYARLSWGTPSSITAPSVSSLVLGEPVLLAPRRPAAHSSFGWKVALVGAVSVALVGGVAHTAHAAIPGGPTTTGLTVVCLAKLLVRRGPLASSMTSPAKSIGRRTRNLL